MEDGKTVNRNISFGFSGDLCLSRAQENPSYLDQTYRFCYECNESVDLAITNLEFCIIPENLNAGRMALPENYASNLPAAGFDVYCLANNHIKDYGEQVMLATQDYLENQGQKTVGVGNNLQEAIKPLYLEKNGFKIAIINVCDATHSAAKRNTAGIAPLKKKLLFQTVKQTKTTADIVIVCIHADLEFTNSPAPWRVKLSRKVAEAGADILVQHHPHTLQGIEYWNGSLIAYSLGNFVFPINGNSYMEGREGFVTEGGYLKIFITDNEKRLEISHEFIPILIGDNNRSEIAASLESDKIKLKVKSYSDVLNDKFSLREQYWKKCRKEMRGFVMDLYYRLAKRKIKDSWHFFWSHMFTQAHLNWIRGFFTLGKY